MKPQSTCKGCKERYVGCHTDCEKYQDYKQKTALYNEEVTKYKEKHQPIRYRTGGKNWVR